MTAAGHFHTASLDLAHSHQGLQGTVRMDLGMPVVHLVAARGEAAVVCSLVVRTVLDVVARKRHVDLGPGDSTVGLAGVRPGSDKGRPSDCKGHWTLGQQFDCRTLFFDEKAA